MHKSKRQTMVIITMITSQLAQQLPAWAGWMGGGEWWTGNQHLFPCPCVASWPLEPGSVKTTWNNHHYLFSRPAIELAFLCWLSCSYKVWKTERSRGYLPVHLAMSVLKFHCGEVGSLHSTAQHRILIWDTKESLYLSPDS